MTEEKLQQYINDFRLKYGITLDAHLKGKGDRKAEAFAERVEMIVLEEIKSKNPTFREEKLKEPQKEAVWKAMLEQGYYLINNYDMNIVSGFDPISNSVIPIDEIRKRSFSPFASKILTNVGLFYSGLSNKRTGTYLDDRRGWR